MASRGIQVCQDLVSYYDSWKGYTKDIISTCESIRELGTMFGLFKETLDQDQHHQEPETTATLDRCIDACAGGLDKLEKKLLNLRTHGAGNELAHASSARMQRSCYPAKKSTLAKFCEIVDDLQEQLLPATSLLGIYPRIADVSTQFIVQDEMPSFEYESLERDQIRVLRLHGSRTGEIECELVHATMNPEQCPHYEALSYTWGSLELVDTIQVNGKALRVTDNLHTALSHLRLDKEDRVLWIDAICINQADDQERSQQVAKMGEIFRSAYRVVVWLGKATAEVESLMHWLLRSEEQDLNDASKNTSKHLLEGLQTLLARPWFNRVWVVQEVANARSALVSTGRCTVPAQFFAHAPSRLGLQIDGHRKSLLEFMLKTAISEPRRHLEYELDRQLMKFQGCEASNERDKVYALWPMSLLDEDAKRIGLDYTMPTHILVRRTVDYLIKTERHSIGEILQFATNFTSLATVCLVTNHDDNEFSDSDDDDLSDSHAVDKDAYRRFFASKFDHPDSSKRTIYWIIEQSSTLQARGAWHNEVARLNTLPSRLNTLPSRASGNPAARALMWDEGKQNVLVILCPSTEELLYSVSFAGYENWANMLLEYGEDINLRADVLGRTLQAAALDQRWDIMVMMLGYVTDVSALHQIDNTLRIVAGRGQETVLKMLFDRGADVKSREDLAVGQYATVLQSAAASGNPTVVEMILNRGADINECHRECGTALQVASYYRNLTVVQMLLDRGADINAEGGYRYGNALEAASEAGNLTVVQMLLDRGVDIHAKGARYGNALVAASYWRHSEIVKILLERGSDVNAPCEQHGSALLAALEGRLPPNIETVKVLLEHGADVNAQGGRYGTALHAASAWYDKSIVEILLERGADVNAQGGKYGSALTLAVQMGHEDIAEMLRAKGAREF